MINLYSLSDSYYLKAGEKQKCYQEIATVFSFLRKARLRGRHYMSHKLEGMA